MLLQPLTFCWQITVENLIVSLLITGIITLLFQPPGRTNLENLTAAQQAALESFPTAWIPDSRYLVELANASYKERLGRDVFLTAGEYRARPTAISLFTWGIYESRADVLEEQFGGVSWNIIHDAAVAKGGWPELGGDPSWGFFKLVVPNPNKNAGGLTAMVAAAVPCW